MCTQTDRVIIDVDSGGIGGLTGQCCTSLTLKLSLKAIQLKVMSRIEKKESILTDLLKQIHVIVGFFCLCFRA